MGNKNKGIIQLAKGYKLIVPEKSDTTEIMVAVGMLIQIWTLAELEHGVDYCNFKKMVNAYMDKIYTDVKKGKK